MGTNYPAQIDTIQNLPTVVDNQTPIQGAVFNQLRGAVLAIEVALGVQPASIYSSVASRMGIIESALNNLENIQIAQDFGGTPNNPLVIGLQGKPLSNAVPAPGQVLAWDGIAWIPTATSTSIFFAGDLVGNPISQTVVGLQNHPISSTSPTSGQVLEWNGTQWIPHTLSFISGVTVENQGTSIGSSFTTINFTGAGVSTSSIGGVATVTVAGGGGGGGVVISSPATITVDPISGNDSNAFPGPWKTTAKVNSYLTGATINNVILSIYYTSDPGGGDEFFAPKGIIFKGGFSLINVTGAITVVHTGTLTSGTTIINPSTQTRAVAGDTVLGSFSTYQFYRLTDLSRTQGLITPPAIHGGHLGAWLINPSGSTCSLTQPYFPGNYGTLTGSTQTQSPSLSSTMNNGDSYQIETRVTIKIGQLQGIGPDNPQSNVGYQFVDLNINNADFSALVNLPNLIRCSITGFTFGSAGAEFTDCILVGNNFFASTSFFSNNFNDSFFWNGGALVGTTGQGSIYLGGFNEYITGQGLAITNNDLGSPGYSGGSFIIIVGSNVQIQDCLGTGENFAALYIGQWATFTAPFSTIWGTNNTASAILGMAVGATALLGTTTVTSSGQDFCFYDANSTQFNTAFNWNPSTAAYVSPASSTTWTNLHGGAFTNGAHYPATGAKVLHS